MTGHEHLPRLFIGSSAEGLEIAYAIQENLEFDAEATVWTQGFFAPSSSALNDLVRALSDYDFAAFVFSADDRVRIRDREHAAARDNVIFELGLFFGRLGQRRCFFVMPRHAEALHLPTDLLGVLPLTYSARRSDGNVVAALGSACNAIRRAFRGEKGGRARKSLQDYSSRWNGPDFRGPRAAIRTVVLDHYADEFQKQKSDVQRVFAFLESLSESVLAGDIVETEARATFGDALLSFWPIARTMLAPPNHAEEWWNPEPKIAELYARWSRQ